VRIHALYLRFSCTAAISVNVSPQSPWLCILRCPCALAS
jgi:hypothetical protein